MSQTEPRAKIKELCRDCPGECQEALDELVHEIKSLDASEINNNGMDSQIDYLLTEISPEDLLVNLQGVCTRGKVDAPTKRVTIAFRVPDDFDTSSEVLWEVRDTLLDALKEYYARLREKDPAYHNELWDALLEEA